MKHSFKHKRFSGYVHGMVFVSIFISIGISKYDKLQTDLQFSEGAAKWSNVEGRVTNSSIKLTGGKQDIGFSYEYYVNNKKYINNKILFRKAKKLTNKEILKKHPYIQKVRVFYSPNKPGSSVLHIGYSEDTVQKYFLKIYI